MMDDRTIQQTLASAGFYKGAIDGALGKASIGALRVALVTAGIGKSAWSNDRAKIAWQQLTMRNAGIDVGAIDGVEGVMFQHGLEQWQRAQRGQSAPRGSVPPPAADSRWPTEAGAEAFFGKPGTNHTRIVPPYQLYYGEDKVGSVLINTRCASSAMRAMQDVLDHYGVEKIHALRLDRFGGCFNDRPMRGGTRKSMHAYAAAIDWDPVYNSLHADRRTASLAAPERAPFLDAWEAQGWTSLGRARDYDWMHVQAVRL